jgi:hypothetical protein
VDNWTLGIHHAEGMGGTLVAYGINVPKVEECSLRRQSEMKHTVVGVDVAKRLFQLYWVEVETGEIVDSCGPFTIPADRRGRTPCFGHRGGDIPMAWLGRKMGRALGM